MRRVADHAAIHLRQWPKTMKENKCSWCLKPIFGVKWICLSPKDYGWEYRCHMDCYAAHLKIGEALGVIR